MNNLTRKITKASLAFAFIFIGNSVFANLPGNGTEGIVETEKAIKQHITFPNVFMPINQTQKVEVVFTTSENGKVNFVLAKTENDILKKQIEKQFLELTLSKIKSNVAYSIVFNIKKI